jgi:hypothetical protein
LKKFYRHEIPHALSVDQKNEWLSYSELLLAALMDHNLPDFEWVITDDESWFFRHYPCDPV